MAKTTGSLQDVIAYYQNGGQLSEDEAALVTRYSFERQSERGTTTRSVVSRVHVICPECQTMAPSGAQWCPACGYGLTDEARSFIQNMERAMKNPANLRAWAEYLEKKGKD